MRYSGPAGFIVSAQLLWWASHRWMWLENKLPRSTNEDRGQTDSITILLIPTFTLALDLDFQSSVSYYRGPYTCVKQDQRSGGLKEWKQTNGRTDKRADTTDRITFLANAVGNERPIAEWVSKSVSQETYLSVPDSQKRRSSAGMWCSRLKYIPWTDVTAIYGHDTIAVCGYNLAYCVELMGDDLPCYSNKI